MPIEDWIKVKSRCTECGHTNKFNIAKTQKTHRNYCSTCGELTVWEVKMEITEEEYYEETKCMCLNCGQEDDIVTLKECGAITHHCRCCEETTEWVMTGNVDAKTYNTWMAGIKEFVKKPPKTVMCDDVEETVISMDLDQILPGAYITHMGQIIQGRIRLNFTVYAEKKPSALENLKEMKKCTETIKEQFKLASEDLEKLVGILERKENE